MHQIDVVQWYLGLTKPSTAVAGGGIYQYDDGRDTSDNINLVLEYPQGVSVTFEASLTDTVPRKNEDIVLIGTGGRLHIFRYGYRFVPADSRNPNDDIVVKGTPDKHMQNFLECVRSRKEPNATVEQGHYGAMACHMGNLAYFQKKQILWQSDWDI